MYKGLVGQKTRSVEEEACSSWQVLRGERVYRRGAEGAARGSKGLS